MKYRVLFFDGAGNKAVLDFDEAPYIPPVGAVVDGVTCMETPVCVFGVVEHIHYSYSRTAFENRIVIQVFMK